MEKIYTKIQFGQQKLSLNFCFLDRPTNSTLVTSASKILESGRGRFNPADTKTDVVAFKENPFYWQTKDKSVTSGTLEIKIRRGGNQLDSSSLNLQINVSMPTNAEWKDEQNEKIDFFSNEFAFFQLNLDKPKTTVLRLYVSINIEPVSNASSNIIDQAVPFQGDASLMICHGDTSAVKKRLAFQKKFDCYDILLKQIRSVKTYAHRGNIHVPSELVDEFNNTLVFQFHSGTNCSLYIYLKTVQMSCGYFDESTDAWSQRGCAVHLQNTNFKSLACSCNHLSQFGGNLFVRPNTLNVAHSMEQLLRPWDNPIGIAIVGGVWFLYLLLMLWARRRDNIDAIMVLPVDLADNLANAYYVYILTIYTGVRIGAGTTSDVHVCLIGTKGTSCAHRLYCSRYDVLQRGQNNSFVIRTVMSLGDVMSLRFWHYNMGKSPSWYLSRAIVLDPQTHKQYYFICQAWLSVNDGESCLDKQFLLSSPDEVKKFNYLCSLSTMSGLTDKHIWFSVFSRIIQVNFTRMQQLTCCLVLLLGYLICNIMLYGVAESQPENKIRIGPVTIDLVQIMIGCMCAFIMMPVSLTISFLFQHARPKKDRMIVLDDWPRPSSNSPVTVNPFGKPVKSGSLLSAISVSLKSADSDSDPIPHEKTLSARKSPSMSRNENTSCSSIYSESYMHESESEILLGQSSNNLHTTPFMSSIDSSLNSVLNMNQNSQSGSPSRSRRGSDDMTEYSSAIQSDTEEAYRGLLPWWTLIIGWTIAMSFAVIFSYFTILYTMEFSKQKTIKWANAVIFSFFIGVLIEQPLKGILLAILVALVFRRARDNFIKNTDEILRASTKDLDKVTLSDRFRVNDLRSNLHYAPPNMIELGPQLEAWMAKREVSKLLFKILRYFILLCLALAVCYISTDPNVFLINNTFRKLLFQDRGFTQITEKRHFWQWASTTFVNVVYGDKNTSANVSDNFRPSTFEGRGMNLANSFLMRDPRVVRIDSRIDNIFFLFKLALSENADVISMGYTKVSAAKAIYYLMRQNWIHNRLSGLGLQLIAYSPNIDIVTMILIVMEMPETGGVYLWSDIFSMKLHQIDDSPLGLVCFGVEIAYFGSMLVFTIYTIAGLFLVGFHKFYSNFWNFLDLALVAMNIFAAVIYGIFHIYLQRSLKTFITKGEIDILQLYLLRYVLTILLSTSVAIIICRALLLFRFNKKTNNLLVGMRRSGWILTCFMFMAFVVFCSGSLFLYLLFGKYSQDFRTFETSLQSVLLGLVRGYHLNHLFRFHPTWGPFIFALLVFMYTFSIVHLFSAIICSAIRQAKVMSPNPRDKIFMLMLIDNFRVLLCMKRKVLIYRPPENKIRPRKLIIYPGNRLDRREARI